MASRLSSSPPMPTTSLAARRARAPRDLGLRAAGQGERLAPGFAALAPGRPQRQDGARPERRGRTIPGGGRSQKRRRRCSSSRIWKKRKGLRRRGADAGRVPFDVLVEPAGARPTVFGVDGHVVAERLALMLDGVAQIEDVVTLKAHRGPGIRAGGGAGGGPPLVPTTPTSCTRGRRRGLAQVHVREARGSMRPVARSTS